MHKRHVVTVFLEREGKILLLLRSQTAATYAGLWAGVSGYIEQPPPEQADREVQEETGYLPEVTELVTTGEPLVLEDPALDREWVIHPFLLRLHSEDPPHLNHEHSDWRWIDPTALASLPTVPGLEETLKRVWRE